MSDLDRRLVIVSGEEGAGKSTIVRALLPHTPSGARIDAEDVSLREAAGADYRYVGIDTSRLDVAATVDRIRAAIPEVYAP
jgi:guanylate kinase